jgi:uncharacterized protein YijF (DUF1287 family)
MALTKTQKQKLTMLFTDMDRADLNLVTDLHKQASRFLVAREASKFVVGDTVQFTSTRGRLIEGIVEKVNRKTINISTSTVSWRVSPSLLTRVA